MNVDRDTPMLLPPDPREWVPAEDMVHFVIEPVFGIIKQVMGYRQTLLRGLEKVRGDWGLVCLAYNFKWLFSLKTA